MYEFQFEYTGKTKYGNVKGRITVIRFWSSLNSGTWLFLKDLVEKMNIFNVEMSYVSHYKHEEMQPHMIIYVKNFTMEMVEDTPNGE